MIVVVADDLSGAAELAGIAHGQGLSAEVQTEFDPTCRPDVLALDTDSRGCSSAEAARRVAQAVSEVLRRQPAWIYKKKDSVLRGHVRAELTALMRASGNAGVLFIPANPARGRIIREGRYLVDEVPLDQTVFKSDPEYPALSPRVLDLLSREEGATVRLLGRNVLAPLEDISIPDIACPSELTAWAQRLEPNQLCAGAGEFFGALLRQRVSLATQVIGSPATPGKPGGTTLLVCGTAAGWPVTARECGQRQIPLFTLPEEALNLRAPVVSQSDALHQWRARVGESLEQCGIAAVAIGTPTLELELASPSLLQPLAEAVAQVLATARVQRLLLEGGATAVAVVRGMGWARFIVEEQIAPGLAALRACAADGPLVAIKPGSYRWPEAIWP